MSAGISALALPFLALSRRENAPADVRGPTETGPEPAVGSAAT